jgi:epoxyqueuosine reductase
MDYLQRRVEVRLDPRRVFAGARTAICVAVQYYPTPGAARYEGDLWPGVARYARGSDYHDLLGKRLETLAERIEKEFAEANTRWYVDTGPVLERDLAAIAGLGVIGKNTNLLHPEGGSWFLLGELFTSLDLEPDPALADLCGSCSRCLDACPTGALPAPYRLEADRCISYWTIEHRGEIPEAVRDGLGTWVFGCDVCQEVCPVNEGVLPATMADLDLPEARARLSLADLLLLAREDYVERFRRSPMKRAKLEGLQRNAAIAMGNHGDERYVEALGLALHRAEPLVRRHVAWALGKIGGDRAENLLSAALEVEPESGVRDEIRSSLSRLFWGHNT